MGLKQARQPIQLLLVREPAVSRVDDRLHFLKVRRLSDGIECPFRPDPHLRASGDPLAFQREQAPVADIVADVFPVGQDLMEGRVGSGPISVGQDYRSFDSAEDFEAEIAMLRAERDVVRTG